MSKYELIVTLIAFLEAVSIFLILRRKPDQKIIKLKAKRKDDIKKIHDGNKKIKKLEKEKQGIINDAKKVTSTYDIDRFLKNISKSD